MRVVGLASLVVLLSALSACIEDPAPAGDPDEPTDVGVDGRLPNDGAPPADQSLRDRGTDAQFRDAGGDSAPILDRGPPLRCDQPDPGSCEAAGCQWSDLAGCEVGRTCRFDEDRCATIPDCVWGARPDTGLVECHPVVGSTCSGWSQRDCRAIVTCVVLQGTCIPAVDAPCDQVAPSDCWRTSSCVEQYADECSDQPKQQEPPQEVDAGIGFVPDQGPQPEAEPEPFPECVGPGECGQGRWCRGESCVTCDVPEACVDGP